MLILKLINEQPLKFYVIILLLLISICGFAQQAKDTSTFSLNGGFDFYYGYHSGNNTNIPYYVSMAKHNEPNINLAYLDINYQYKRFRTNITPAFGTYMDANYAAENVTMQHLVSAYVGLQINKQKNIWVDAGILPAPYTLENALSKEQLMYTRSLASEGSPYFVTGARVTIPLSKKTIFTGYLINGWQQIRDVNSQISLGSLIEIKANKKHKIGWSIYVGNEKSNLNPTFGYRYYTDVQWTYLHNKKLSATSVVSLGLQNKTDTLTKHKNDLWWQANFIAKYNLTARQSIAARTEFYNDPFKNIVTPIIGNSGFAAFGNSICYSLKIKNNALFRVETKHLYTTNNIQLDKNNKATNQSWLAVANITIWF